MTGREATRTCPNCGVEWGPGEWHPDPCRARPAGRQTTGWLDPEPPHAEHTVTECRRDLPPPRDADHGRRYRCVVCGRTYRAHHSEQREPQPYWVGPLRDEGVSPPAREST